MKIYTKTGDDGMTGLYGGPRVRKDDLRIDAYGTVDELNALLGLVRTQALAAAEDRLLERIQNELFDLGAELATPDPSRYGTRVLGPGHIGALEQEIDAHETALEPLKAFILPGGCEAAARLHVARTVCRRAERLLVALAAREHIADELVVYLNRLGDLLFVLARWANHSAGQKDVPWRRDDEPAEADAADDQPD
ncbi:MAG TPA: cob(I)yrinic acid a,c-diamide adenosyltransferase [Pirellulales bacterium]|nr:cob(I)yrinic acid a,c-diamide adenosyltransferase [Pirellulales bacterium]